MQRRHAPQSSVERRRRLELEVGDERAEHDPRAVPPRDQHRVLAVEADAAPRGRLAVDVLVRVDEHAVRAAEPPAELVELRAQLRVAVEPGVARQAAAPGGPLGLGRVVAERGRDDGARAGEQRLGMAGALGLRHRELHVGEEPARPALADVALGAPRRRPRASRRRRRGRAPRRAAPVPRGAHG